MAASSLSFKAQCAGARVAAKAPAARARAAPARAVARCAAEEPRAATLSKQAAALALAVSIGASGVVAPEAAHAGYAGLQPCATNKKFEKGMNKRIKGLKRRQKTFEKGSAPYVAIGDTIAKAKARTAAYKNSNLLCGADGYPHLIVDGNLEHLGEFVFPGLGFLYISGWIGWVGRKYLIDAKAQAKPTDAEIIIDVPKALGIMFAGWSWPALALTELRQGELLAPADEVTVSPR